MTVADYTETAFARLPRLHHKDALVGPSSAGFGKRNLVGLMGVMMGGGGTANPYVTDGLVQWYDGIWNSGIGTHAESSSTWKDLVGTNDATLTQYASIGVNSINIIGQSGSPIKFKGDITNEYTIEIVARLDLPQTQNAPRLTAENPYPSLYFSTSVQNEAKLSFYGQGADSYFRGTSSVSLDRTVSRHYAATFSTPVITGFVDGEEYGKITVSQNPSSVATATIGNRLSGSRGFNGAVFAFRRYNRALTSTEIASNYAVDKARFGLA